MTKHIFNTNFAEKILKNLNSETAWTRIDPGSEYHKTYSAIVNFAKDVVDNCPKGSGSVLACATYGWMPTIMKDFKPEKTNIPQPIQSIKETRSRVEALSLLQKMGTEGLVKNSWIGSSKFIHFLNPSMFPIWDTRVAEKFSEHCINHYLELGKHKSLNMPSAYAFANNKENYKKYTAFMLSQLENKYEWLQPLSARFFRESGYRPSDIRLLELMLFYK